MKLYIVGSLRNPEIPNIANRLRAEGFDVFDDWYAAGPEADDHWKAYEQARGRTYKEALKGAAAKNVFAFDKKNIDASDAIVLVLPAGRSGHIETGYAAGTGKKAFVLMEGDSERWDVMYQFCTTVVYSVDELIGELNGVAGQP